MIIVVWNNTLNGGNKNRIQNIENHLKFGNGNVVLISRNFTVVLCLIRHITRKNVHSINIISVKSTA
jgi:hypothetical protein